MIKIIDSGKNCAEINMERDEKFLETLNLDQEPILHFYEFEKPAATYGHFVDPKQFLKEGHGLNIAKRPTGGGILFHMWDFTFSVLIPSLHPNYSLDVMKNYKFINDIVALAILEYKKSSEIDLLFETPKLKDKVLKNFCFAVPTQFDVMIGGKKVAGAAQRRKKNGFLHQGSISLVPPDFQRLKSIIADFSLVVPEMEKTTFILTNESLNEAREKMRFCLSKAFQGYKR